jgi:hypothetical protein
MGTYSSYCLLTEGGEVLLTGCGWGVRVDFEDSGPVGTVSALVENV